MKNLFGLNQLNQRGKWNAYKKKMVVIPTTNLHC